MSTPAPTPIVGKAGWQTSEGQIVAALHVVAVVVGIVLGIVGSPHDAQVFGEYATLALGLADGLYAVSRSITKVGVVKALAEANFASVNAVVAEVHPEVANRLTNLETVFRTYLPVLNDLVTAKQTDAVQMLVKAPVPAA